MHNYASGFLIFNYEYSLVPTGLCRKCTVFHLLIRRLTHPLLCSALHSRQDIHRHNCNFYVNFGKKF